MREGRQRATADSVQLDVPAVPLCEGVWADLPNLLQRPLGSNPDEVGHGYPREEVEDVVLLRCHDTEAKEHPFQPENDEEELPWSGTPVLPGHPDRHQACEELRVDDVQARPGVPWVVREMDELEQDKLPPAERVPVYLVPEVYLRWEQEEYYAAETSD